MSAKAQATRSTASNETGATKMCHAHANPVAVQQLAPEVLELALAHDEWRRSQTREERIWSNGPINVILTTSRCIEIQVGLLKPYTAQIRQRSDYLEAKQVAIRLAQGLEPKVKERNELLMHFYYPSEREEVEAQARLFLLDWITEIDELYERFDPLERAMEAGHERSILSNISQALANTIF